MDRLTAIQYRQTFTSGHSCPCLIEAESIAGERHEVVLKLRGSVTGGHLGLAREALASSLAEALHLDTPASFAVEISEEFAASVATESVRARLEQNIGWHFGSTFLRSGWHAAPYGRLPHKLFDAAAAVLAFDALVRNDDRHVEKTNYLVRGATVMMIDHERAFPTPGAGTLLPWEEGGLDFLTKHAFYPGLRGQLPSFEPIAALLETLTAEKLSGCVAALPEEWTPDGASERFRAYLMALRMNFRNVLNAASILLR